MKVRNRYSIFSPPNPPHTHISHPKHLSPPGNSTPLWTPPSTTARRQHSHQISLGKIQMRLILFYNQLLSPLLLNVDYKKQIFWFFLDWLYQGNISFHCQCSIMAMLTINIELTESGWKVILTVNIHFRINVFSFKWNPCNAPISNLKFKKI